MGIGAYGILVIFGLFILILVANPKLSCFGKRISSPFYPLVRRKHLAKKADGKRPGQDEARKKTEDYGFKLD